MVDEPVFAAVEAVILNLAGLQDTIEEALEGLRGKVERVHPEEAAAENAESAEGAEGAALL